MTKLLTKIPDIAYSIKEDLIEIEQSTGLGEFTIVGLHKIHLQLLAEQMGLFKPIHQVHMGVVVNEEMRELFWSLEDHWQSLCNSGRVDIEHMVDSKNLYNKLYSICRLIGLDPDSLSNLEAQDGEPGYPTTSTKKDANSQAIVKKGTTNHQHSLLEGSA